jgi:hypothetical protein
MTRTLAADAVMSACAHAVSGPVSAVSEPPEQAVPFSSPPGSGASAGAGCTSFRHAVRACRLRPPGPPMPRPRAEAPHPPCPRQPVPVDPLYLYLPQWHAATHSRWSFDPGRDI